jgi:chromosome transmission fidelity protein 18
VPAEEVEEAGGGKKPGKKGKSHAVALSRPIIGIANDLYAPALRPLREVAKVFHFKVHS